MEILENPQKSKNSQNLLELFGKIRKIFTIFLKNNYKKLYSNSDKKLHNWKYN